MWRHILFFQLSHTIFRPELSLALLGLLQSDAFDFIALAIGIAATIRPAASVLYPTRRLPRICGAYNWFALMFSALVIGVMYIAIFSLLDHQSWYTGGNGDDAQVMPCLVTLAMQCVSGFARSCCCVSCWEAL